MENYTLDDLLWDRSRLNLPKPKCVVLCGSTQPHFLPAWQEANWRETLAGNIVLTIGCDTKSDDGLSLTEDEKFRLDLLHLCKIDLADEVLIVNAGGYIGASTKRELLYALRLRKLVRFYASFRLDPDFPFSPVFAHCPVCDGITFWEPFRVEWLQRHTACDTGAVLLECGHPVFGLRVYPYVSGLSVRS